MENSLRIEVPTHSPTIEVSAQGGEVLFTATADKVYAVLMDAVDAVGDTGDEASPKTRLYEEYARRLKACFFPESETDLPVTSAMAVADAVWPIVNQQKKTGDGS